MKKRHAFMNQSKFFSFIMLILSLSLIAPLSQSVYATENENVIAVESSEKARDIPIGNSEKKVNHIDSSSISNSSDNENENESSEKPIDLWDIENENNVKYDKDYENELKTQDADELNIETKKIYDHACKQGIINPNVYSFEEFKKHETLYFLPSFKQFVSENPDSNLSYEQWIEQNNYGVFPQSDLPVYKERPTRDKRGYKENQTKFVNAVKKGELIPPLALGYFFTENNQPKLIGNY
ncbi:hypothetical protein DOK76_12915 [Vagococcus sp. DIV0080]|uniref:Uncharacterized protein n=1 Tax=Candidatus Vagococcus giribetii TaxID=2230876 RepID=A0ABS3HW31_9ENTE|nr:hypothetical protein [Vagococcus sp. DIV0080]MBO0477967.1 hypothetical protein [Vagococcus sp. DIV0080]